MTHMTKNFDIKQMIEIRDREQRVHDIHNNYDFKEVKLNSVAEARLEICFDKTEGDWVSESDPEKITFVFEGVKYLEFSKGFFTEETTTVDEMGYKDPEDFDYDWLMDEEHFTGGQHFVFRFVYDEHIRIFAERIELLTEYKMHQVPG